MKKVLKILGILILVAVLIYAAFHFFLSGKSSFRSIYLIPPDAAWILESEAPFDAWETIVHSDAWQKVSHIDYLATLNNEIRSIDSLLSHKRLILKTIGHRKILVSTHEYLPGKYDFLFIINIGRLARLHNPEKILSSLLGDSFHLTKRTFENSTIYELLDSGSGEMYIFSFLMDKMIMSTNYKLVEASLKETDKMTLGRDLEFIDVSKRISGRGLFNVYINFKYFPDYINSILGKAGSEVNELQTKLTYAAFTFDIAPGGMIDLEGYSGVNDTVVSLYSSVLNAGAGGIQSQEIIPARVASMVKISFNNATDYYNKILMSLNKSEKNDYQRTLQKYEKKLKISLRDNLLSWIDDEILLLQTQPSNLGRNNEFAAILVGKNNTSPKENLNFIGRQIERNTPIKLREVRYGDYTITYISFPGLIKALFGKMLGKIEKPYYTIIDHYVIFSNHPQTLKNIIDDYTSGNTLENSPDFKNFTRNFNKKNSGFSYFDIPVLFSNLREFVNTETWQKLDKNKVYITSFPKLGIQIDRKDELLHLIIKAEYKEAFEEYDIPSFDANSFLKLFTGTNDEVKGPEWYEPVIIIHDLDASEMELLNEDGSRKFIVELKNGLKHGTYKEFYPNGNIRVKGKYKKDARDGTWKLYDEDENLIEEIVFSEGKEVTK